MGSIEAEGEAGAAIAPAAHQEKAAEEDELNYAPEPVGIGQYSGELAEWLAARAAGGGGAVALSSLPGLLGQVRWRPQVVLTVAPAFFCAPGALLLGILASWRSSATGRRRCWDSWRRSCSLQDGPRSLQIRH